jgi:hypothetical protein
LKAAPDVARYFRSPYKVSRGIVSSVSAYI